MIDDSPHQLCLICKSIGTVKYDWYCEGCIDKYDYDFRLLCDRIADNCDAQVVNEAIQTLRKEYDKDGKLDSSNGVVDAICWEDMPQGRAFWEAIHDNIDPCYSDDDENDDDDSDPCFECSEAVGSCESCEHRS